MDYLNTFKRLKAMADTGLHYATNEFDKERYEELLAISYELISTIATTPIEKLKEFSFPVIDYPTPMVDVRGLLINEKSEVLLVQEVSDGKWSIPGGWADVGLSPSENVLKEIHEESGLECAVERLLAVFDKKNHPHPPQPHYVYKLIFYCKVTGGRLKNAHDIGNVGWFAIDKLPSLSTDRILESQLIVLFELAMNNTSKVLFD